SLKCTWTSMRPGKMVSPRASISGGDDGRSAPSAEMCPSSTSKSAWSGPLGVISVPPRTIIGPSLALICSVACLLAVSDVAQALLPAVSTLVSRRFGRAPVPPPRDSSDAPKTRRDESRARKARRGREESLRHIQCRLHIFHQYRFVGVMADAAGGAQK